MSKIKRTLQMTSLLFGMAVAFCYIAWCLGYEGFILVGRIEMPLWIAKLICAILLCINLSLLNGFVLNDFTLMSIILAIPTTGVITFIESYFPPGLFNGVFSTLILIIMLIRLKSGKWGFVRLGVALLITFAHQLIVSLISVIDLTTNISIYQGFRLSIDAIILMLLLYSIGGVTYYDRQNARFLELVVFPGRVRDDQFGDESRQRNTQATQSTQQINKRTSSSSFAADPHLSRFEQWVMRAVIASVQIIQWMFILWVCNLDNLLLDALVITVSFICHGMIIQKRKHLKPIILCTLAATAMFYFAARFTVSFRYSHFFPILVGLLLTYTVYRISYEFEKAEQERAKKDLERITSLEKQMQEAWTQLDKLS